jgi:DNA-3-methyladenine glycosylase I
MTRRCEWADSHPLYVAYHDEEWGVPLHGERRLFEMLVLEAAQAGLSWLTILRKREAYRQAFDEFDIERVAGYGEPEVERLLANAAIVRNRRKIEAAIRNARAVLAVQGEFGTFDAYIWQFVDGRPQQNTWRVLSDLPAQTAASQAMSKDLGRRGFRFVGPTICYAFMQSVGMVNDHLVQCFRHQQVAQISQSVPMPPRDLVHRRAGGDNRPHGREETI